MKKGAVAPFVLLVLLLVTVLAKPLLALMRGHFMALALLSTWHGILDECSE
jgi:hypothetical protein